MSRRHMGRPRTNPQTAHEAFTSAPIIVTAVGRKHEPSAWLHAAQQARIARFHIDPPMRVCGVTIAYTGGPQLRPGSRADRTCDRCCVWVPPNQLFTVFATEPQPEVVLVTGLCSTCARLEGVAA